jgi:UDP-N-acetylmuramate--alanine ligase
MDPDHLDIYGNEESIREGFLLFLNQTHLDGSIVVKKELNIHEVLKSERAGVFTYSILSEADYSGSNIRIEEGTYVFDFHSPYGELSNVRLGLPGRHNVENAVAAIAAAQIMGVLPIDIRKALISFKGVNRRFDYRINTPEFVYIDDYAHHPEEIKACLNSVKQLYPHKKITGIFQPHLYSRTRDFSAEFSASLSLLDEVILMDIYPARELAIQGVTSTMLLNNITCTQKQILNAPEILNYLKVNRPEVLVTIGAGDIDQLVAPIEKLFTNVKANE